MFYISQPFKCRKIIFFLNLIDVALHYFTIFLSEYSYKFHIAPISYFDIVEILISTHLLRSTNISFGSLLQQVLREQGCHSYIFRVIADIKESAHLQL